MLSRSNTSLDPVDESCSALMCRCRAMVCSRCATTSAAVAGGVDGAALTITKAINPAAQTAHHLHAMRLTPLRIAVFRLLFHGH